MSKYDRWRASKNIFEIVPHDTDEILTDSIRAPSDGVITFRALDDSVDVSHPVRAGEIIPVRTRYIRASGTTVNGSILAYAVSYKDYTQYTNLTPDIINGVSNVIQPSTATALNQFGFVASPGVRTNLAIYSQEFDNAGWAKAGGSTVSANTAIAPNGTLTADTWSRATTGSNFMSRSVVKSATPKTLTFSVFAKKGSGRYFSMRVQGLYPARSDVTFDLDTGLVSNGPTVNTFTNASASITPLADGWYRCTLTSTTDSDTSCQTLVSFSTSNVEIDGSSASAVADGYLWGSQLELGNKATAYIPTTTAAVSSTLPRFEYDMGEPIVGASRTNKCINNNTNPTNLTNIDTYFPAPNGLSTVTLVDDTAALTAAGLIGICSSGKVIKIDNSAGNGAAFVYTRGTAGNTNTHTGSAFCRKEVQGGVSSLRFSVVGTELSKITSAYYQRVFGSAFTAANSVLEWYVPAGEVVYFILNQLEEGAAATDVISVYGAAVTTNLAYSPKVRGLLVEPTRTNLCTHSENPTNGVWNPTGVVKTSTSEPDPFGTNKAALITALSGNQSHYLVGGNASITYESGKDYTFSVFLKVGSQKIVQITWAAAIFGAGYFNIDIENGVVGGGFGGVARVVKLANGWCRVSLTMTATGSGLSHAGGLAIVSALDSTRIEANPLTTNFYAVGWQLEQAPEPSSYIPTTTSAVTRPADVLALNYTDKPDGVYTARLWHSDYDYTEVDNLTVLGGQVNITGVTTKPITKISLVFKSYLLRTQIPDVLPSQYNVIQPSVAMRVSAAGVVGSPGTWRNLAYPSQDMSNATWTVTNATKTSTNNPDLFGTSTALLITSNGTGSPFIVAPAGVYVAGQAYTMSGFFKAGNHGLVQLTFNSAPFGAAQYANFDIVNGVKGSVAGGTSDIKALGDGWFRLSFTAVATASVASWAGVACFINILADGRTPPSIPAALNFLMTGWQLELGDKASNYIPTTTAPVANTLPRFEYDMGILRGLLVEPARTNFIAGSATLGGGMHAIKSGTIASTVEVGVAPDNSTSVRRLNVSVGGNVRISNGDTTGTANTAYAGSVYVRTRDASTKVLLVALNDIGSGSRTVTGEWSRISATAATNNTKRVFDIAFPVGDYEIWGGQLEQASDASSYIPTTTAAVMRQADILNLAGLNKANGRYTARCWHSNNSYTDVPNITVTNGAASIIGVSVKPIQAITFL